MFKKKFKDTNNRVSGTEIWLREIDKSLGSMRNDHYKMMQQYDTLKVIKMDMAKMDALTAMVGELARRLDLAGVADLPSTCVCETCGCNRVQ